MHQVANIVSYRDPISQFFFPFQVELLPSPWKALTNYFYSWKTELYAPKTHWVQTELLSVMRVVGVVQRPALSNENTFNTSQGYYCFSFSHIVMDMKTKCWKSTWTLSSFDRLNKAIIYFLLLQLRGFSQWGSMAFMLSLIYYWQKN